MGGCLIAHSPREVFRRGSRGLRRNFPSFSDSCGGFAAVGSAYVAPAPPRYPARHHGRPATSTITVTMNAMSFLGGSLSTANPSAHA